MTSVQDDFTDNGGLSEPSDAQEPSASIDDYDYKGHELEFDAQYDSIEPDNALSNDQGTAMRQKWLRYGPVAAFLMVIAIFILPLVADRSSDRAIYESPSMPTVEASQSMPPTYDNDSGMATDEQLASLPDNPQLFSQLDALQDNLVAPLESSDFINATHSRRYDAAQRLKAQTNELQRKRAAKQGSRLDELESRLVSMSEKLTDLSQDNLALRHALHAGSLKQPTLKSAHSFNARGTAFSSPYVLDTTRHDVSSKEVGVLADNPERPMLRHYAEAFIEEIDGPRIMLITRACRREVLREGDHWHPVGALKIVAERVETSQGYVLTQRTINPCMPMRVDVHDPSPRTAPVLALP